MPFWGENTLNRIFYESNSKAGLNLKWGSEKLPFFLKTGTFWPLIAILAIHIRAQKKKKKGKKYIFSCFCALVHIANLSTSSPVVTKVE